MKHLVICVLGIMIAASTAFAERVFTEDDLDRYSKHREAAEEISAEDQPVAGKVMKKDAMKTEGKDNRGDAEEWCAKGQAADDRVSAAALNVARTSGTSSGVSDTYGDRYSGATAVAQTKVAADAAKREFTEAKIARDRLHENAHRLGIPPGWLRCQF